MRELADAGILATVTCRVLKLSRQPCYRWLANPITPSEVVEAYRANALFGVHLDDLCAVVEEDGRTRHVFAADAPNQLWLVDITEHKTAEGKLYCCAIKDACSGRIVGYWIDSRMKSRLAVEALENAVEMRSDVAGCVAPQRQGQSGRIQLVVATP